MCFRWLFDFVPEVEADLSSISKDTLHELK